MQLTIRTLKLKTVINLLLYKFNINLVETINHMVDTEMDLQPGPVVLGMVLDTLSGRSPLYRLKNFLEEKDIELLLGNAVSLDQFTDHNIGRVLDKIFETGTQKIFGQLSQNAVNGFQIKPTGAHYDTTSVTVYGDYAMTDEPFISKHMASHGLKRAIVIHSSAHDKRRHKKIERLLSKSKKGLEQQVQKILSQPYYCDADARAAVKKLSALPKRTDLFTLSASIEKVPKYPRGRPKTGDERIPERFEYRIEPFFEEDEQKIQTLREEAGCFVLLSNLILHSEKAQWSAEALLRLYKNQSGIEQNFGFLKDPVIINSVFLKKNSRIEVLGMILLISLLI